MQKDEKLKDKTLEEHTLFKRTSEDPFYCEVKQSNATLR